MKRLEDHFIEFIAHAFPTVQPDRDIEQVKEMRRVFFAGCVIAYSIDSDFSEELFAFPERVARGEA